MAITPQQKRLLFKIPLDKRCSIHPDPAPAVSSLLILTHQGDLYYSALTGRQLKFVRNNVESLLWTTSRRFLLVDSSTHDLLFYKIETVAASTQSTTHSDNQVQFVSILHFAFQVTFELRLKFRCIVAIN